MNKKVSLEDIANMEEVMERTAGRADIWQDRLVYAIAKAVWHLLTMQVKKM